MALQKHARPAALRHLRGSVLSLGYPDGLEAADLCRCQLTVVDIKVHRGGEIIADLNAPLSIGEFDFVIDPGTIEHCFNVSQAMLNACAAVKPGGHILHTPPISLVNHGFYNLSPCFFKAFYDANGFQIKRFDFFDVPQNGVYVGTIDTFNDEYRVPPGVWALVIAKRVTSDPVNRIPIQQQWR